MLSYYIQLQSTWRTTKKTKSLHHHTCQPMSNQYCSPWNSEHFDISFNRSLFLLILVRFFYFKGAGKMHPRLGCILPALRMHFARTSINSKIPKCNNHTQNPNPTSPNSSVTTHSNASSALISVTRSLRSEGATIWLPLPYATSVWRRGTILKWREMPRECNYTNVPIVVKVNGETSFLMMDSFRKFANHAKRAMLAPECSLHQSQPPSFQHQHPDMSPIALRKPSKSKRKSSLKEPKLKKKSSVKAALKSKKDLRLLSLRSKKMKGINSLLLLTFRIQLHRRSRLLIPITGHVRTRRLELHLANGAIPTEEQK